MDELQPDMGHIDMAEMDEVNLIDSASEQGDDERARDSNDDNGGDEQDERNEDIDDHDMDEADQEDNTSDDMAGIVLDDDSDDDRDGGNGNGDNNGNASSDNEDIDNENVNDSDDDLEPTGMTIPQIQAVQGIRDTSRQRKQICVALHARIHVLKAKIRQLRRRNRQLEQEKLRLHPRPRRTKETWRVKLHRWHYGRPVARYGTYDKIYKLACRESNTAPHPERVHPDLKLVPQREAHMVAQAESAISQHHGIGQDGVAHLPHLPLAIITLVLRYLLYFPGEVVHVLSRLDPYEVPQRQRASKDYRLINRFHVGTSPVSLTYSAVKPSVLLAALLASRLFHFIGTNIFYGMNYFAFSSLGEFGFFCSGIGPRVHRIQHLEIMWTGSQWLTYNTNNGKYTSRRTRPLQFLTEMPRLRNLVVHLQEGVAETLDNVSGYTRRKYEPRGVMRFLQAKTHGHDNVRLSRNLRGLQGIDNVRLLRGMDSVTFLDWDRWFVQRERTPIKDQSFQSDINQVVLQPKSDDDLAISHLPLLASLNDLFTPSQAEWYSLRDVCPELARPVEATRPPSNTDMSNATTISSDSSSDADSSSDEDGAPDEGENESSSGDSVDSGSNSSDDSSDGGSGLGSRSNTGTTPRTWNHGSGSNASQVMDLTGDSDEEMEDVSAYFETPSEANQDTQEVDMLDANGTAQGREPSLFLTRSNEGSVTYSHSHPSNEPRAFGASSNGGGTVAGSTESDLFVRSETHIDLTQDTDEVE